MANDYPFNEVAMAVDQLAAKGWDCYQKFTCRGCGRRLTMDEPNILYTTGKCEDCGYVTDIKAHGCNYLLIASLPSEKARRASG